MLPKNLARLIPLLTAAGRGARPSSSRGRRRTRRPASIIGVIVAVAAALWSQWNRPGPAAGKPGKAPVEAGETVAKIEPATIARVIDGDTVEARISGRKLSIRLMGIDAMDSHNEEKRDEQAGRHALPAVQIEALSKQAAALLQESTGGGQVDIVHASGSRQLDDYQRVLAYIEVNGRDVAEGLLAAGLAEARREPHPRSSRYRDLEKQARSARAGIWQNAR
ncbi:MAG: thermonuclease family protein [Kiritimatiellia bacterium]